MVAVKLFIVYIILGVDIRSNIWYSYEYSVEYEYRIKRL